MCRYDTHLFWGHSILQSTIKPALVFADNNDKSSIALQKFPSLKNAEKSKAIKF